MEQQQLPNQVLHQILFKTYVYDVVVVGVVDDD